MLVNYANRYLSKTILNYSKRNVTISSLLNSNATETTTTDDDSTKKPQQETQNLENEFKTLLEKQKKLEIDLADYKVILTAS